MADKKKSQCMYQRPVVKVVEISEDDVIKTSPETMGWSDGWNKFTPNRDNTFFE